LRRLLKDDAVGVWPELILIHAGANDVGSLCLVKECAEMFGCVVVQKLFEGEDGSMKKVIMQKDCNMSIQKCKEKAPLIAEVVEISRWP